MNSSDFAWLVEHGREIYRDYAGKWIAVHDGKVIGVGDTAPEAAEKARAAAPGEKFILEAVEAEPDAIYADV